MELIRGREWYFSVDQVHGDQRLWYGRLLPQDWTLLYLMVDGVNGNWMPTIRMKREYRRNRNNKL